MARRGRNGGGFRPSAGGPPPAAPPTPSGPSPSGPSAAAAGPVAVVTEGEHPPVRGPHPGYVSVACQYTPEWQLRQMQREHGCDPAREDNYRLQGVQLIDNVREALQLPVKTFATACTYYHKFRLNFRDAEYNFQDAALSALFVACKVEDTIKKSREVLCAAYNLKNPDKPTTPDDKIFDRPSAIIVGLDRLILQTVGFDFRVRHPQKLLVKLLRTLVPATGAADDDARRFLALAYPMSIDLYKTFAPIKQTSFTMALAVLELTARVLDRRVDAVQQCTRVGGNGGGSSSAAYHTTRGCVVETLLDLLDLYTQFPKLTKVGARVDLARFIDIKIQINREVDEDPGLQRIDGWCDRCAAAGDDGGSGGSGGSGGGSGGHPLSSSSAAAGALITPGSVTASPATSGTGTGTGTGGAAAKPSLKRLDGTLRFVFQAERVRQEEAEVKAYFCEDYEEEEMEVDEPLLPEAEASSNHHHRQQQQQPPPQPPPPPQQQQQHRPGGHHNQHHNRGGNAFRGHGPRRDRNGKGHPGGGGGGGGAGGAGGAGGGGGGGDAWGPYPRNRNNDPRNRPRKGGYY